MSIRDVINSRLAERALFLLEPVMPDDPVQRTMLISPEVRHLLSGPWGTDSDARRANRLRADLERFITGQLVGLCLTPYQARTAYMGRLDRPEDEVWDIRSVDPSPGLRVFGRFAERDVFIALSWRPRSEDWASRKALRSGKSLEWHFVILECHAHWKRLFPGYQPVRGESISDYVSENAFLI
jgi:hypothetical protein